MDAPMIMPEKLSLSDFVSRRLHPMKVTIHLLHHEIAQGQEGDNVTIDSSLLGSVVSTMELFVEDYEKLIQKSNSKPTLPAVERKFVTDDIKK
jgi:hypothetical protein